MFPDTYLGIVSLSGINMLLPSDYRDARFAIVGLKSAGAILDSSIIPSFVW